LAFAVLSGVTMTSHGDPGDVTLQRQRFVERLKEMQIKLKI